MMWSIEVRNLTKDFGSYRAVNRISFTVSKGEIFGFLGANGAGKTTAIRMLCGLLAPSGGEGKVAGFDITKEAFQVRRHIGYMSQKFSLYLDLTVRQNMALYGSIYGLDRRRLNKRIDVMTSLLSMGSLLDRTTGTLPQGWRQRCALACADLHEPDILFLDEPTGSVDPVSRKAFWDLILLLARNGKTVLVTTHHMDEAEYCHRISIMIDGTIAKLDTPQNLRRATGTTSLNEAFLAVVESGCRPMGGNA
ncbi:MAG: ABC transporter ATP-binding protein [Chitinispirillaceae bacterium]|nr:ABC transporter ATP-binding protein [Chitinispirillaceae bacterium]